MVIWQSVLSVEKCCGRGRDDILKRIMLIVAYDGTDYHGWQFQPGVPTIEGELNKALEELLGEKVQVTGASRTDAGVHALCNGAVFDTETKIPAQKISYALNQRLPEDIKIQKSMEVPGDFHPRHHASQKTYEYRILNREFPLPTKRRYSYFTYVYLDEKRMQKGADFLVGEHDFKSFCASGAVVQTTVRTIDGILVEKQGDEIIIRVWGGGFLYNMVRIIAGTLMEVGRGNLEPGAVKDILAARDRGSAGPTAPACGLTLVDYKWSCQGTFEMIE